MTAAGLVDTLCVHLGFSCLTIPHKRHANAGQQENERHAKLFGNYTETGPRGGASRKSEDFFRLTGESVRSKRVSRPNDEVVVPNVPGRSQAEKMSGQVWLILAFPGDDDVGDSALRDFVRSAAGTSWYWFPVTREQADACKRELTAAGIRYIYRKVERLRRHANGRGKAARKQAAARKALVGQDQAIQIYEASVLAARKAIRTRREAGKLQTELERQADLLVKTAAIKRAQDIAERFR